jgi:hypothetical protein
MFFQTYLKTFKRYKNYGGPEVQHRILVKHQIQITNIKFKLQTSNSNSSHQI